MEKQRQQNAKKLKNFLLGSNQLQTLLNSKPKLADSSYIAKWKNLPRLTVEGILEKSGLAEEDLQPDQLQFKTGVEKKNIFGLMMVYSGFFLKGTDELRIGRRECRGVWIEEGMFKGGDLHGFGR